MGSSVLAARTRQLRMAVVKGTGAVRLVGSECTCSGTARLAVAVAAAPRVDCSDSRDSCAYRKLPAALEQPAVVAVAVAPELAVSTVLRLVVAAGRQVRVSGCCF